MEQTVDKGLSNTIYVHHYIIFIRNFFERRDQTKVTIISFYSKYKPIITLLRVNLNSNIDNCVIDNTCVVW